MPCCSPGGLTGPSGLAVSVIFLSVAPDGGLKGIPVNQGGGEGDLSFTQGIVAFQEVSAPPALWLCAIFQLQ